MMKGLFIRSIEQRKKIMIVYLDQKEQLTQRYIRVLTIHDDRIIAYCYWRQQIRHFKFDHILAAGPIQARAHSLMRSKMVFS